jgi:protein PhnA
MATTSRMEPIVQQIPPCPKCRMENTYPDGANYVCADCGHEWPSAAPAEAKTQEDAGLAVKDAHGNRLADGDAVILIKDLKLKGSSTTIKGGTKIKNIRLVEGDHEVDCKVDGMEVMLKAMYLKKA